MDLADVGIYRFIMMHGTIIRALIIVSRVSGFIYFAKEKHLTCRWIINFSLKKFLHLIFMTQNHLMCSKLSIGHDLPNIFFSFFECLTFAIKRLTHTMKIRSKWWRLFEKKINRLHSIMFSYLHGDYVKLLWEWFKSCCLRNLVS